MTHSRTTISDLEHHLTEALGAELTWESSDLEGRLPIALRSQYDVRAANLLGHRCVFLIRTETEEVSSDTITKHLAIIQGKSPEDIVMVMDQITPYLRRRLVAERIPFVVPGAQIYLPFLGMMLKERFQKSKTTSKSLRPAAQATILWWIHHGLAEADTARALAPRLNYTPMSLSRAFDDIEHLTKQVHGLTVEHLGRERKAQWRGNARELWQATQPFMRDPVIRREVVVPRVEVPGYPAGLTGLSVHSDVVAPAMPVIAVERSAWIAYKKLDSPAPAARGERGAVMVEVWRYAPDLHRDLPTQRISSADPLSIMLSIAKQSAGDERVEAATAHMIAEYPWRW